MKKQKLIYSLIVMVIALTVTYSCKKKEAATTPATSNTPVTTVTDIDHNVYNTVVIGKQTWMKENLKTAHYSNGNAIEEVEDSATWANIYNNTLTTPAWCMYRNNIAMNNTYGKLYNYYAVVDPRNLCPAGWHVPSDSEWEVLGNYLGGDDYAGGQMKSLTGWDAPNAGADNLSGFTGLPAGFRNQLGSYSDTSHNGYWWSTTNNGINYGWYRNLNYSIDALSDNWNVANIGRSVRCVKN